MITVWSEEYLKEKRQFLRPRKKHNREELVV